jgi:hypothetical protein
MPILIVTGLIVLAISIFTYLPENLICQLDDTCIIEVEEAKENTNLLTKQDKVVSNAAIDVFILIGEHITNTVTSVIQTKNKVD